jgi:oxygen-independent coproporphyrinogen-3 oxidase
MVDSPHIYVHVPFCDGKCGYCAFYSVRHTERGAAHYLTALSHELALRLSAPTGRPRPATLYIGGGTPTVLSARHLEKLCRLLARRFDLSGLDEWTVEANPGTLDGDKLAVLKTAGVTRISLGVQSFHDGALRAAGRRHTAADVSAAVRSIRGAFFHSLGFDLIAGLPGVSAADWAATLDRAIALHPDHLSVYGLTLERGTPLAFSADAGHWRPATDAAMLGALHIAARALRRAGYRRYEVSNYARHEHECRHNLAFWRGADYIGFGPSASSRDGCRRWANAEDLAGYIAALHGGRLPPRRERTVSRRNDAIERRLFGFRTAEGVCLADAFGELGARGTALRARWSATAERLRAESLLSVAGDRWRLTARGWPVADHVIREFYCA